MFGPSRSEKASTKIFRLGFERLDDRRLCAVVSDAMVSEFGSQATIHATDVSAFVRSPVVSEGEHSASSRTNALNRFDVNSDGVVAPIDVLTVINFLERSGPTTDVAAIDANNRGFYDVNRDAVVTSLDILQVINFLSRSARLAPQQNVGKNTYAVGNSLTVDWSLTRR